MITLTLDALLGKHFLSGVDLHKHSGSFGDSNCISFILDGVTITAVEDPEDGWRSCLGDLFLSGHEVKNIFPEIEVLIKPYHSHDTVDAIECIDIKTQQPVLTVGTDTRDGWYPCFLSDFIPENMCLNGGRK